jgi:hypothetical protein
MRTLYVDHTPQRLYETIRESWQNKQPVPPTPKKTNPTRYCYLCTNTTSGERKRREPVCVCQMWHGLLYTPLLSKLPCTTKVLKYIWGGVSHLKLCDIIQHRINKYILDTPNLKIKLLYNSFVQWLQFIQENSAKMCTAHSIMYISGLSWTTLIDMLSMVSFLYLKMRIFENLDHLEISASWTVFLQNLFKKMLLWSYIIIKYFIIVKITQQGGSYWTFNVSAVKGWKVLNSELHYWMSQGKINLCDGKKLMVSNIDHEWGFKCRKGKVVPVLNQLSTIPWMHMGEWM